MGQRQRPKPEVRRRVRDTPEAEFDGVNDLMNDYIAKVVVFLK